VRQAHYERACTGCWQCGREQKITAFCQLDAQKRQAENERAFALWQADYQSRVHFCQISLPYQSGAAPCEEPTDSTVLSFGCAFRRRCIGQKMGEHLLTDRLTFNDACEADRFCCSIIRVSPSAGGEAGRDCASICSLADRLPASRTKLTGSAVPSFGYCPPAGVDIGGRLLYNNRRIFIGFI